MNATMRREMDEQVATALLALNDDEREQLAEAIHDWVMTARLVANGEMLELAEAQAEARVLAMIGARP